jgi:hypothetical protein
MRRVGGYGANRRQTVCGNCGHAVMAHLGGGCAYCPCRRVERSRAERPAAPGTRGPGTGSRGIARLKVPPLRWRKAAKKTPGATPRITKRAATSPSGRTAHAALIEFTAWHFSPAERTRFLSLIASAHGHRLEPAAGGGVGVQLARFVESQLDTGTAKRYLRELTRRLQAGEPLIQR